MHYQERKRQNEIFRQPVTNYFDTASPFSIVSLHRKSNGIELLSLETERTKLYDLAT